jgi:hypothetical protein
MEGSVLGFLKAECKVSDTGSELLVFVLFLMDLLSFLPHLKGKK